MSIAPRYAIWSKGLPKIAAWEQPECPAKREHRWQFSCWRVPHSHYLLKGIWHHKLAMVTLSMSVDVPHNEWNCVALAPAAEIRPYFLLMEVYRVLCVHGSWNSLETRLIKPSIHDDLEIITSIWGKNDIFPSIIERRPINQIWILNLNEFIDSF
jgi:hypothetical protein